MPLDQETIDRLVALKSKPRRPPTKASTGGGGKRRRLTRKSTQYATLPSNPWVKYWDGPTRPCTSYGCGAPSNFKFQSEHLCNQHLIFAMVHEALLLNKAAYKTSGADLSSRGTVVSDAPLVISNSYVSESGANGDNEYL